MEKIKTYFVGQLLNRPWLAPAALFGVMQFFAPFAYAQTLTIDNPQDVNSKILCPIAGYMFYILIGLSTIMILYAGFQYITAGGDSEKVGDATKTITYAAVGIAVALIAKAFPNIVASILGQTVNGC